MSGQEMLDLLVDEFGDGKVLHYLRGHLADMEAYEMAQALMLDFGVELGQDGKLVY